MKIAILYDWIDKWGGAERILETLFKEYPEADLYTLYIDYKKAEWAFWYSSRIKTTFMQSWQQIVPFKQLLAPLMPMAAESLDLSEYDLVLSISSSFMKGVITRPETKHVGYLFTPTRFLWHERAKYFSHNLFLRPLTTFLRSWDYIAGQRPDRILTLSKHSQNLIKQAYQRESEVIYPPFDLQHWGEIKKQIAKDKKLKGKFKRLKAQKYYLVVSRLEPYKTVDLVVKVFQYLTKEKLLIVGFGTELRKLKRLASANVEFINSVSDQELGYLYQEARALIMPQAEDFGYTALESLFFETPVVSYAHSGVAEMIKNEKNGCLFQKQTPESLLAALEKSKTHVYNFNQQSLKQFSKETFLRKLKKIINS